MSVKMQVVDIRNKCGPTTSLCIAEIPKPIASLEGHHPLPTQAVPVIRVEFSGTIGSEAKGCNNSFQEEDEVFGLKYGGAHAEYIAVNTHMLLHKPVYLSREAAAGIPETWISAIQAIKYMGSFARGKSILWHAGASAVSIAGIQLSRIAGASEIYVTAGCQENIKFCLKELGATGGFNYKSLDQAKEVLKATKGTLGVAAKNGVNASSDLMSRARLTEGTDIGAFIKKRLRCEGSR